MWACQYLLKKRATEIYIALAVMWALYFSTGNHREETRSAAACRYFSVYDLSFTRTAGQKTNMLHWSCMAYVCLNDALLRPSQMQCKGSYRSPVCLQAK